MTTINVFKQIEIAKDYDHYYESDFGKRIDNLEKIIIGELIDLIPTGKMLELGCGTGHWTAYFSGKGFNVTGLDNSQAMLDLAINKKLNARFILGDSAHIPFVDKKFEIVSTITMLEFVDDIDLTVSEMIRVLKPKGYMLIGFLNANSVLAKTKSDSREFKNANFFTLDEILKLFSSLDLVDVKQGVYLNEQLQILDFKDIQPDNEPTFIAALFYK